MQRDVSVDLVWVVRMCVNAVHNETVSMMLWILVLFRRNTTTCNIEFERQCDCWVRWKASVGIRWLRPTGLKVFTFYVHLAFQLFLAFLNNMAQISLLSLMNSCAVFVSFGADVHWKLFAFSAVDMDILVTFFFFKFVHFICSCFHLYTLGALTV